MVKIRLSRKVEKKAKAHNIHTDEIRHGFNEGLEIKQGVSNNNAVRRNAAGGLRLLHPSEHVGHSILKIYKNTMSRFVPVDHGFKAIDLRPIKLIPTNNLSIVEKVWKEIQYAYNNIPNFNFNQLKLWIDDYTHTEKILLINEIHDVVQDKNNRYNLVRMPKHTPVEQQRLEKVSAYRKACDFLNRTCVQRAIEGRGPTGLLNEAYALKRLRDIGFNCPHCGGQLMLGGGCSTAWADIACSRCPTFIEVKTRFRDLRGQDGTYDLEGGSFRWFHAQRNAGVRHYVIVIPKRGGDVWIYKPIVCNFLVDDKFFAYFNHMEETGLRPTLRTKLRMERIEILFTADNSRRRERRGATLAKKAIQRYFYINANKIIKLWKQRKR